MRSSAGAVNATGLLGRDRSTLLWLATGLLALGLVAVLFGPTLASVAWHWTLPEYNHGWLIPPISLFVLWQRRDRILAARGPGSWGGPLLVVAGLALLALRSFALMQIPAAVGFVLVLAGLGLAGLGARAMRYVWLPLAFLLFALPVPGTLYVILSTELQLISSQFSAWLLRLAGVVVFLDGNIIDLGVYKLQVAEACSGLRYLFPLASFGFLCAWLYRAPLWARAVVLLAFVPITVLTNSFRIAFTGLLVEYGSIELAQGFFHLFEGWVISLVAIAMLFALMALLARLAGRAAGLGALIDFDRIAGARAGAAAAVPAPPRPTPGAPLVACLGLLLGTVPALVWLEERPAVIPERPGLVTYPLELADWQGRLLPVERETLAVLGADDYLLADYAAPAAAAPVNLWIAYYGAQVDAIGTQIHGPKSCLPGNGWEFMTIGQAEVAPGGATPFVVNRAVIVRGEEQMLMYYWYEQRGRRFADEAWTKIYLFLDLVQTRRSDGALVRLMTPIRPGESAAAADRRIRSFLDHAYPPLEPHVGA